MDSYKNILKNLMQNYKNWVCENPATAAELETMFKWVSLFLAGRVDRTPILTECAYTVSNLIVFINDRIIASFENNTKIEDLTGRDLRIYLTVLEYSEVLIEIFAKTRWGNKGKWRAIWGIQLLKSALRLVLLLRHNARLLGSPALPLAKRVPSDTSSNQKPLFESISFTLKHSRRVIRKVQAAPPMGGRSWKPPKSPSGNSSKPNDSSMTNEHLAGELIYIFRPIFELTTRGVFGSKSWRPWLISLVCDLSSLYLLKRSQKGLQPMASEKERLEISRRCLLLLFYLMRSPFYEKYSKDRLYRFLDGCSSKIPLARFLTGPLEQYLPYFQNTYGYTWST